jgi:ribonuclease Y
MLFQITSILLLVLTLALAFYSYKLKHKTGNSQESNIDIDQEVEKKLSQKIEQIEAKAKEKYSKDLSEHELKKIEEDIKERLEEQNQVILEKRQLEMQKDFQQEERIMHQRMLDLQENLDKKETQLDSKLEKIEQEREKIDKIKDELRNIKEDLLTKRRITEEKEAQLEKELTQKLEEIAKLSQREAREKILDQTKESLGNDLLDYQRKMLVKAEDESNQKAREIVSMAIQRCSSEVANEITITSIKLSGDEDKGKIIGKQGRNIQWLEKTLGVELIVDETPEVVTISGFSSVRRNIAKKTLEKLLADGRIHPSSIEEMYEKAKAEVAQEIADVGEEALNSLGIYDFPAKLVRLIGRLQYRTSYGQNMLKHSLEMAKLAGLLADEVNEHFPSLENPVDKMICMKGALLHDIGKAIDEEFTPKGNHVDLGEKICDMFNLDWRIKKCISSHHNEEYEDPEKGFCVEAVIVDACDNISGGRPGARKEAAEAYFQRLEGMEKIAKSAKGVNKSWVMRGSRELWVFFDTKNSTPAMMHDTTRQIAKDIANQVTSPVKIKVIGFFEDRAIEYAA